MVQKSVHLVRLSLASNNQSDGGLEIEALKYRNALLAKWGHRFHF